MSNELDRIRKLANRIWERHSLFLECEEGIKNFSDGKEKDKLIQEIDSHREFQYKDIEEIDKLSRKVVKEIDYLKLPAVSEYGNPIGRRKAESPFGTPKHQKKCKNALKMYEKLVAGGMNETTAKNRIRNLKEFNWNSIGVCEKMLTNGRNILKAETLPQN